jgi:hypothetical protein
MPSAVPRRRVAAPAVRARSLAVRVSDVHHQQGRAAPVREELAVDTVAVEAAHRAGVQAAGAYGEYEVTDL